MGRPSRQCPILDDLEGSFRGTFAGHFCDIFWTLWELFWEHFWTLWGLFWGHFAPRFCVQLVLLKTPDIRID